MSFPTPLEYGVTIYSKEHCKFCTDAKKVAEDNNISPKVVDCESFLHDPEIKTAFKEFIQPLMGAELKSFPIIFNNGTYVGGYTAFSMMFVKEEKKE